MRLLADLHISPRTVEFLRQLGHDVVRCSEVLPPTAPDALVVSHAARSNRAVLTQDLGFSAIVALSRVRSPSIISLRLSSARVDVVNRLLANVLPRIEEDAIAGSLISVEDTCIRVRRLPVL